MYTRVVRPILFRLPPEAAHDIAKSAMRVAAPATRLARAAHRNPDPRLSSRLGSLSLTSPVGLAAGFDKDAEAFEFLQQLGFGYVIVGSILEDPRRGNAKPRILRVQGESLINCMGLPSEGVDSVVRRLRRRKGSTAHLVGNVQGFTIEDYCRLVEKVEPWVDAIELSMLCPNVVDRSFDFMTSKGFERLMLAVSGVRRKPLFVKFPSYDSEEECSTRLGLAEIAASYGVDAVTISGAFVRPEPRLSIRRGNVTGRPALGRTLQFVKDLRRVTEGRMAIKALGGISSGSDAYAAISAGASSVELLTSFVYRGPNVVRLIEQELLTLMDERGVESVTQLRGSET